MRQRAATLGLAEMRMRDSGLRVVNPLGTTCVSPSRLCFLSEEQRARLLSADPETTFLPVVTTTELLYNASPQQGRVASQRGERDREAGAVRER